MELNTAIEKNTSSHQPKWLILFRIILGLILFWKGISFIHDSSRLEAMVQSTGIHMFNTNAQLIAFVVPYLNLLCGLFIAVGLFTRWASIIQLPILIAAVIFVNVKSGMSFDNYELVLSVIVLILLVVFVVKGSGVLSADEYFHSYYKAGSEPGNTKKIFE
jgi:putative oxidoreductase